MRKLPDESDLLIRPVIKAVADDKAAPVGTISAYWNRNDPMSLPEGYLELDGRSHRREDYPELAKLMRPITGRVTWHVRKRFYVPDSRHEWLIGVERDKREKD